MNYRLEFFVVSMIALTLGLSGCSNGFFKKNNNHIDLDQDVTNNLRPKDSIFIDFEKNWKKFISPVQVFTLPVILPEEQSPPQWEPLIFSDCVFSEDAGGKVVQVELQWQELSVNQSMRFDMSLQYQGFEKGYYTTIMAVDKNKRFNIPMNSSFIKNTEAVLLVGTPLFPKMLNYAVTTVSLESEQRVDSTGQGHDSTTAQKQHYNNKDEPGKLLSQKQDIPSGRSLMEHKLLLRDLGFGLSYKIRICTLEEQVWRPTQEYVFSTPICPTDDYDEN